MYSFGFPSLFLSRLVCLVSESRQHVCAWIPIESWDHILYSEERTGNRMRHASMKGANRMKKYKIRTNQVSSAVMFDFLHHFYILSWCSASWFFWSSCVHLIFSLNVSFLSNIYIFAVLVLNFLVFNSRLSLLLFFIFVILSDVVEQRTKRASYRWHCHRKWDNAQRVA